MRLPLIDGHSLDWYKKHDFQGVAGYWTDLMSKLTPLWLALYAALWIYAIYRWVEMFFWF